MIDQGPDIMKARREAERRRERIDIFAQKLMGWLFTIAVILAVLAGTFLGVSVARADMLMASPTRVELGVGRNSSGDVRIVNQASVERKIEVSLKPADQGRSADLEWARFAPKTATLPANGGQTIRMIVAAPRGTEPGTYRLRLHIRDLTGGNVRTTDQGGVTMGVKVRSHLSLPVIVEVPK